MDRNPSLNVLLAAVAGMQKDDVSSVQGTELSPAFCFPPKVLPFRGRAFLDFQATYREDSIGDEEETARDEAAL